MSAHTHDRIAPPGAIAMAAALMLLSILLVAAVRFEVVEPARSAAALREQAGTLPSQQRSLRFQDGADGAVLISDADSGEPVAKLGREGSGFVRGVMRGLARERRQHGFGSDAPFRLTLWRNGALTLADPLTGRVIELNGFGQTNRQAFASLLRLGAAS